MKSARTAVVFAVIALVVVATAAPLGADSSVPVPGPAPSGAWRDRCAERLRTALRGLAAEDPDFAAGRVIVDGKPRVVRFEALVPDHEHARFFPGQPAHYWARIEARVAAAPGELGSDIGSPRDSQASLGSQIWTTARYAKYDVQIVDGKKAFRFRDWIRPAVIDCLK